MNKTRYILLAMWIIVLISNMLIVIAHLDNLWISLNLFFVFVAGLFIADTIHRYPDWIVRR